MTSREPLRVGIIGAGTISTAHARSLQAIAGARLVGFADVAPAAAEAQAQAFGVRAFKDVQRLLSEVDAVTICTPVETHACLAIEALLAGKHVLTEKPMAPSLAECDQMMAAAERGSAQLSVVYQNRFNRYANRLKWLMDNGRLGRQVFSILNQASTHGWDLLRFIAGDPAEVSAHWAGQQRATDTLVATIRFVTGWQGLLETAPVVEPAHIPPDRRVWLYCIGECLTARYTMFSSELVLASGDAAYQAEVAREIASLFTGPAFGEGHPPSNLNNVADIIAYFNECHRPQIEAWVNALRACSPVPVPGWEARKTIEFHTAVYKSGVEGHPVRLPLSADDPWYTNPPKTPRG